MLITKFQRTLASLGWYDISDKIVGNVKDTKEIVNFYPYSVKQIKSEHLFLFVFYGIARESEHLFCEKI